jgi:chromosome segregation ATPase
MSSDLPVQSGSAATPIRPRMQMSFHPSPTPRSKRALSFSGGASQDKIQALEAEVENLRLQAMPGLDLKDIEKLRVDLETAKRHAMKMENEKLAVERSIQREMEHIKSKLSDANDELNYLRAFDGQSVQQQLDVTKKSANQERAALEEELQKRSDELEKRRMDVVRLEGRLRELESDSEGRKAQIVALESQLQAAQKTSVGGADLEMMRSTVTKLETDLAGKTMECTSARERIVKLEAKLESASSANATTAVAAPNDAQAAKIKRAHQREVDDLRRAKETLERHLAESEELVAEREIEIFELKRHMPLPGEQTVEQDPKSASMTSEEVVQLKADLRVKVDHMDKLLQEKEQVERDLRTIKAELAKAQNEHSLCGSTIESLQDKLSGKSDEVLELVAKNEVSSPAVRQSAKALTFLFSVTKALSSELDARQEQIEAFRADSQGQDAVLRTQLNTMERELDSLKETSMQNNSLQIEFQALKDQLKDLEQRNARLQEMEASLVNSHESLNRMTQEKEALAREVSSANLQLEAIRAELVAARSATESFATEKQALIEKKQREADSYAAEAKRKDSAYK